MKYWLMKTEPSTWSWRDQVSHKKTHWDGVRNYQASSYMKEMKKGDLAFFYHSVKEKAIVGIVGIVREYYPDFTDETGKFGMVDVQVARPLPRAVSLEEIKSDPRLTHLHLCRQSRLSVMPIDEAAWDLILEKGKAS